MTQRLLTQGQGIQGCQLQLWTYECLHQLGKFWTGQSQLILLGNFQPTKYLLPSHLYGQQAAYNRCGGTPILHFKSIVLLLQTKQESIEQILIAQSLHQLTLCCICCYLKSTFPSQHVCITVLTYTVNKTQFIFCLIFVSKQVESQFN